MWRLILLLLAALNASALIFPLLPDEFGAYDASYNVLRSYNAVWATNHHAVINVGSLNGVAVAPRWFLTAWHVAAQLNTNSWANDDDQRFFYRRKVDLGNDLALVEVDRPFPFYSQIQKHPGGEDDIVTLYGQSGVPEEPILDKNGVPRGWKFGPVGFKSALRWGQGRLLALPSVTLRWNFARGDQKIGNGGLNCATVATNDSGGGIFEGDQVIGVIKELETEGFRTSLQEPSGPECAETIGHIFDTSNLYRCGVNQPLPPTRGRGAPVYPALSNIFAQISPPRYFNAGGGALSANSQNWEAAPECSGCSAYVDSSAEPISTAGLSAPAPPEVYQSGAYLHAQPEGVLTFTASELIKYEKYNVRLHFAAIGPADAPGACAERVSVNGAERIFDPYTGPRKASLLSFEEVSPDENSQITVVISPQNSEGNALICGIEVALVPLPPREPEKLTWDATGTYPSGPYGSVIYGNETFVSGLMFSRDSGGTWQPMGGPDWDEISQLTFFNGHFWAQGLVNGEAVTGTSIDGSAWTQRKLGATTYFLRVAHGNELLVATAFGSGSGLLGSSTNGMDWTFSPTPGVRPESVIFANGTFLVSDYGFTNFFSSSDGQVWDSFTRSWPELDDDCPRGCNWFPAGVIGGGSQFVAYGYRSNKELAPDFYYPKPGFVLVSPNGRDWSRTSAELMPLELNRLSYVNGDYIYFPDRTFSRDLLNWQSFELPIYASEAADTNFWQAPYSAAFGSSNYVVLGSLISLEPLPAGPNRVSRLRQVWRGKDLHSLERIGHPANPDFRPRVATDGNVLVIANPCPGLPVPVLVSTNSGATYVPADLPAESAGILSVYYGADQFIAVGEAGKILRSHDGLRWETSFSGTTLDLYDVSFGADHWVAVGTNGVIVTSQDGVAFAQRASAASHSLNRITYGPSGFVSVGDRSTIASSSDGQAWSVQTVGEANLFGITWGDKMIIAVGEGGYIKFSEDGSHWSSVRPITATLRDICFYNGLFVALEPRQPPAGSQLYLSRDGLNWLQTAAPLNAASLSEAVDTVWFVSAEDLSNLVSNHPNLVGRLRTEKPEIRVRALSVSSGVVALTFDAPILGRYEVQFASDPASLEWNVETVLTRGRRPEISAQITNEPGSVRFYRIRLQ